MIVVIARHELRPEAVEEFPGQLREFTDSSRREPGVISFDWARSVDDPSVCFLIEVFRDARAGEAHVHSDHFQAAIKVLPQLLVGSPTIIHVESVAEGWDLMAEVTSETRQQ